MEFASLKIKNLTWKLYVEDPETSKEESFNDSDCGDTVFMTKKIYLNSNLDYDLMYETIKHELVHAYLFSYGMGQIKFDEEVVCDIIATYGEEILRDAKDLFKIYKEVKNEL